MHYPAILRKLISDGEWKTENRSHGFIDDSGLPSVEISMSPGKIRGFHTRLKIDLRLLINPSNSLNRTPTARGWHHVLLVFELPGGCYVDEHELETRHRFGVVARGGIRLHTYFADSDPEALAAQAPPQTLLVMEFLHVQWVGAYDCHRHQQEQRQQEKQQKPQQHQQCQPDEYPKHNTIPNAGQESCVEDRLLSFSLPVHMCYGPPERSRTGSQPNQRAGYADVVIPPPSVFLIESNRSGDDDSIGIIDDTHNYADLFSDGGANVLDADSSSCVTSADRNESPSPRTDPRQALGVQRVYDVTYLGHPGNANRTPFLSGYKRLDCVNCLYAYCDGVDGGLSSSSSAALSSSPAPAPTPPLPPSSLSCPSSSSSSSSSFLNGMKARDTELLGIIGEPSCSNQIAPRWKPTGGVVVQVPVGNTGDGFVLWVTAACYLFTSLVIIWVLLRKR